MEQAHNRELSRRMFRTIFVRLFQLMLAHSQLVHHRFEYRFLCRPIPKDLQTKARSRRYFYIGKKRPVLGMLQNQFLFA